MLRNIYIKISFLFCFSVLTLAAYSQEKVETDLPKVSFADSTKVVNDSISIDSLSKKEPESDIKSPINFSAKDSMHFSLKDKKISSFGNGKLSMDDMKLDAGFISVNLDSSIVSADALIDKNGKRIQEPKLEQGGQKYDVETLRYNTKTKRGIVEGVVTKQNDGYLHGGITKMHPNKEIHITNGKYTTCDAKHPHFYIKLSKAKVIPEEKIVTGPFWFVIADIPIFPLGLPFGFFPNQKNRRSGIIIPSYGEEKRRGFYLQDLGYYWAAGENIDFTFLGSIFTSGSWTLKAQSRYKKRYKYNGNFDISYQKVVEGEEDIPKDYREMKMFWVKLNYARDQKANPTSTFRVSVDFGSSKSRSYNSYNPNDFANNNASSSIAYTKTFPGTPFNFSANVLGRQDLSKNMVDLTLPTLTFNMNRQFPFKRKKAVGEKKWYEQISVGFSSQLENRVSTADSMLFKESVVEKFENGFKYSIPISTSFKVLKHFNLSPSINYQARIYTNRLKQRPVYGYDKNGNFGLVSAYTDTVPKNKMGLYHIYDFSFSTPLSTKLYGMKKFKKGKIAAIRHIISPSVSFNYRPDFGRPEWGYYTRDLMYPNDPNRLFSIYGNGIYGTAPSGKSGSIGFGIDNNLEMKVHSNDTTQPLKKIVLLNSLRFGSSYNIAADSMNLAPISISANTRLFKTISITYSGLVDVYMPNKQTGGSSKINKLYITEERVLGHLSQSSISLSGSISSETFKKKDKKGDENNGNTGNNNSGDDNDSLGLGLGGDDENDEGNDNSDDENNSEYNFKVPWNISISYSLRYSNSNYIVEEQDFESKIHQNITINSSFTLTPKWSLSASGSYDFTEKKLTYTNVNIGRDLHCWTMGFSFVPFGTYKSYNFHINIKNTMFQGLKYEKRESFRDNFEF